MKIRISAALFFLLSTLALTCHGKDTAPTIDDLIIWEIQDWKSKGTHKRLTLWRDGYSEIEIVPALEPKAKAPRPNPGWERIRDNNRLRYVHRNAYTPDMTRKMFRKAIRAGIKRLRSFRPPKKDDGGTRVVISLDGSRKELLIPHFKGRYLGTTNHRRFQAVSAVLGHFDTNAYLIPGAKPKPVKPKSKSDAVPVTNEPAKADAAKVPAKPEVTPETSNEAVKQATPPTDATE